MTLSTRVEQAGEGSFMLDCAIHQSLYDDGDPRLKFMPKPYTVSIDAALSLVPDDMRDEIEIVTLHQVARVVINLNHGPDDGPYYGSSEVNSIPLAICAAALKARGL